MTLLMRSNLGKLDLMYPGAKSSSGGYITSRSLSENQSNDWQPIHADHYDTLALFLIYSTRATSTPNILLVSLCKYSELLNMILIIIIMILCSTFPKELWEKCYQENYVTVSGYGLGENETVFFWLLILFYPPTWMVSAVTNLKNWIFDQHMN